MNVSVNYRFEGSVFFVYDHNVLQKEEDRLEDAILYFYPHSMPIDNQCLLCGQLMGLVQFSNEMFGSAPILYRFKKEKIAVKHVAHYSFALAGSHVEPDSMLINQLDNLYNLFSFYHGSIDQVKLDCNNDTVLFLWEMRSLWEQYLAFIRHYGDHLPSVFNPVPYLPQKDVHQNHCFLKASHFLQACQRRPSVIAGCVLYNRFILCSQLTESISRCLLLLKPNQNQHPAIPIETDFQLPYGVRLFSVYLNKDELNNLLEDNENSPYNMNQVLSHDYKCCCETKRTSIRRKVEQPCRKTSQASHDSGQQSMAASEKDPVSSTSTPENTTKLCKAILEDLILKGFKCCKCIDDVEGELDEGSLCGVGDEDIGQEKENIDEIGCERLPEESEVVLYKVNLDEDEVVSERVVSSRLSTLEAESGIEATGSDWYSSTTTPFDQTSEHIREGHGLTQDKRDRTKSKDVYCIASGGMSSLTDIKNQFSSTIPPFDQTSEHTREPNGLTQEQKDRLKTGDMHKITDESILSLGDMKGEQCTKTAFEGTNVREGREFPQVQKLRTKAEDKECITSEVSTKNNEIEECRQENQGQPGTSEDENQRLEQGAHGSSGAHSGRWGPEELLKKPLSVGDISHSDSFEDRHGSSLGTSWDNLEPKRILEYDVDVEHPRDSGSLGITGDNVEYPLLDDSLVDENRVPDILEDERDQSGNDGSQLSTGTVDDKQFENVDMSNDEQDNSEPSLKCCQVDGLVHANLFVQAHSEIVLILLTKCDVHQNEDTVKSLWTASLSQLGELDMLLRNSARSTKEVTQSPYNYFIYDNFEKTMSGNVKEPVYSGDLVFCDTAKSLHHHFDNSPQLVDVTLRNLHTGIYGGRTLSKEVYFQEQMVNTVTSQRQPQDASSFLEKKVRSSLLEDHGIHLI